ncbi:SDR family NAD(P)-dependent oxidoreductase [Mycolicibacterium goodii]|uniref:SDR family NAD(P)-dependent oxidoreductase n=1 Tax=Mycolicibacterium goodii TaxID=134601 RepID=UPI000C25AD29|nr:SDR family oxidoreductase [Mycolicibacterium goodii]PJK20436.1 short-chain dehydrogenase [Mycolicibacterium goodii]
MTQILSDASSASALLAGKVAVVTGGGNGIGEVCARLFVSEGARVIVADYSGRQDEVASTLGTSAHAVQVDVRVEDSVDQLFARAEKHFGPVDILINVAGTPGGRRGDDVSRQEFDDLISVHLLGTMLCNQRAIRSMSVAGGSIVNFSSVASLGGDDLISPAYAAAKAGINALTKSLAVRYGPDNIRVNAIAPGFTLSAKNQAAPAEIVAERAAKAALGRAGQPAEQAAVAAFLASDRSSFVTGVVLPVDGGWSCRLA